MWSTVLWGRSLPVYFTYVLCLYKTIGFQTISTRLIEVDINDVKLVTYFIFIFRILTFYVLGNDEYNFRHITVLQDPRAGAECDLRQLRQRIRLKQFLTV